MKRKAGAAKRLRNLVQGLPRFAYDRYETGGGSDRVHAEP